MGDALARLIAGLPPGAPKPAYMQPFAGLPPFVRGDFSPDSWKAYRLLKHGDPYVQGTTGNIEYRDMNNYPVGNQNQFPESGTQTSSPFSGPQQSAWMGELPPQATPMPRPAPATYRPPPEPAMPVQTGGPGYSGPDPLASSIPTPYDANTDPRYLPEQWRGAFNNWQYPT